MSEPHDYHMWFAFDRDPHRLDVLNRLARPCREGEIAADFPARRRQIREDLERFLEVLRVEVDQVAPRPDGG